MTEIHFAPLQGYADYAYRREHARIFGGADAYYTPFMRIEKGEPRRHDVAHLDKSAGDGTPLVPQIIFNSVQEFEALVAAVRERGYHRIDLNLGCPYPMQTKKGRGAAMMADIGTMSRVAELVNADPDITYSVKMRLGMREPDEWRQLMPVLNSMRLEHVTLHPRVATQLYKGELCADEFERFLGESANPVIWNGDIATTADIQRIVDTYPGLKGVMIGRGFLGRPSLGAEWAAGREWSQPERMSRILQLHDAVFDEYRATLCGDTQILQKIKPLWEYLEPEIGHKACKAIRKATSLDKYTAAVKNL